MATAGRINVSPLPQFDPVSDPSSLGQRWTQWKRRFETYILAVNVTNDAQKRALLLYQAGAETQQLYDTLPVAEGEAQDYATTIEKLDAYFLPQKNVDFEIFQFRKAKQHVDETTDQYVTRLRKLAAHCEFADLEKELKATIIQNCVSKSLRRFALREEKLTLENLLSKARALEASEAQAKDIEVSLEKSEAKSVQFFRKNTSQSATDVDFHGLTKTNLAPPQKKHAASVVKRDISREIARAAHNLNRIRCHNPVRINVQFLNVLLCQVLFVKFKNKRKAITKLTAVRKNIFLHA